MDPGLRILVFRILDPGSHVPESRVSGPRVSGPGSQVPGFWFPGLDFRLSQNYNQEHFCFQILHRYPFRNALLNSSPPPKWEHSLHNVCGGKPFQKIYWIDSWNIGERRLSRIGVFLETFLLSTNEKLLLILNPFFFLIKISCCLVFQE